jgi:hypothetical protein
MQKASTTTKIEQFSYYIVASFYRKTNSSLWTYLVSRVGLSSLELLDAPFYTFRPYHAPFTTFREENTDKKNRMKEYVFIFFVCSMIH